MTTFTLQDLNLMQQKALRDINDLPTTPEEDEAMDALARLGGGVVLNHLQVVGGEQHAPIPQPSQVSPEAVIDEMLFSIKQSLLLLTTVIRGEQARGNSQAPSGENSLQETVSLTLEQADWFKDMVEEHINGMDLDNPIETYVERYCENYFSYSFDPRDHFDIDEAVADRVDDRLEDLVAHQVAESLEEVVAEKLSEANISISF